MPALKIMLLTEF